MTVAIISHVYSTCIFDIHNFQRLTHVVVKESKVVGSGPHCRMRCQERADWCVGANIVTINRQFVCQMLDEIPAPYQDHLLCDREAAAYTRVGRAVQTVQL